METQQEPWEQLEEVLETEDHQRLQETLETLSPAETARALSRLSEADHRRVLTLLEPEEAADLLEELSDTQAAGLIEELLPLEAAAIMNELSSDEQADLLGQLDEEEATVILQGMEPDEAADVRLLSQFASDHAGGLMITEYLAYADTVRVADVLDDLREHAEEYAEYEVQYAYVIDQSGRLLGVLRLRDLLLSPTGRAVTAIMIPDPVRVQTETSLDELHQFFERHDFFGVPVTDEAGQLLGVVRRTDVQEAMGDQADQTFLKSRGIVGGEEFRGMPLRVRAFRRLSWLSINIVLNLCAASVIAFYQETLVAVIALAVFLPIISDMSGCSGNQAVAVSLRELTLGLVKPYELTRVLLKEAQIGVINGVVLGCLLGAVSWVWQGNPYLGLVVGGALALNTLVAVMLGGTVPLLLRRLELDPALASGPILTTVTDMCGFFLVLSFASMALSHLTR
jgi:magnesium transporter